MVLVVQASVAYYLMSDNRRRMPSSAYLRADMTEAGDVTSMRHPGNHTSAWHVRCCSCPAATAAADTAAAAAAAAPAAVAAAPAPAAVAVAAATVVER